MDRETELWIRDWGYGTMTLGTIELGVGVWYRMEMEWFKDQKARRMES